VASRIIQVIGVKQSMSIACLFDGIWAISQALPALKAKDPQNDAWYYSDTSIICANIGAAICSGVGSSLLWVAQGHYISDCAKPSTKGFYFGYFWAMYMAS
jgi:hypothetical protein